MANQPSALAAPGKFGDLKRRLMFLLGALIVYRIGAHIPVPGIDPVALARALYYVFTEGDVVSGASTIPQQLVKMTFLTPERTLTRKLDKRRV